MSKPYVGPMTSRQAFALTRLRKWADPKAAGNPTQRLTKIWPNPLELVGDISAVLVLVDELGERRTKDA